MIPVLACPILNRPELLDTMIASIDTEVGRLYIIDNGDVVPDRPDEWHVCRPGANLGVAASWNLAIRANLAAPWWLFVNNDIVFGPGALDLLAETMDGSKEPLVGVLAGYAAFAINDRAIEAAGWFDENFTPMYYEDTDWQYRSTLAGVRHQYLHSTTRHAGQQSWLGDPVRSQAVGRISSGNRALYHAKWGGPEAGSEKFTTPYDAGVPVSAWQHPTLARLRAQDW